MISGPLPAVSVDSAVIVGCGWSYTNFQHGSVIAWPGSMQPGGFTPGDPGGSSAPGLS